MRTRAEIAKEIDELRRTTMGCIEMRVEFCDACLGRQARILELEAEYAEVPAEKVPPGMNLGIDQIDQMLARINELEHAANQHQMASVITQQAHQHEIVLLKAAHEKAAIRFGHELTQAQGDLRRTEANLGHALAELARWRERVKTVEERMRKARIAMDGGTP